MVRLDSNAAWKEASALVAANRDVLFTLAGVFFLLPGLAQAVFVGEPDVAPGAGRDQIIAAMVAFYSRTGWLLLLSVVLQVIGMLAILTLMRDRSRPTVGEAIAAGLRGAPSYLGAQLLFGLAVGLVGGFLIGLGALLSPPLAVLIVLFVLAAALALAFRLVLVAPIVALEGVRNPVEALRRSWRLTRGNGWRIVAFLVLVLILFAIVLAIVMLIVGMILAILTSGTTQTVIAALASGTLTAIGLVYVAGMLAAMHRQLAGAEQPAA